MLRLKLSKFKQVCLSILLPKSLLKSLNYPNDVNYNRTFKVLSKARKSTNSGSKNEGDEKQKDIIQKCLSENISEAEAKVSKKGNEIDHDNIISPEFYNITKCNKCDTIISKLFNNKTDIVNTNKVKIVEDAKIANTSELKASTSKTEEEKFAQKIEIIDETPHVEAHAPKAEGFNTIPKVLGHENCSFKMAKQNNQNIYENKEQINLDELAKRCMGSPISEIDTILTREIKNVQKSSHPKLDIDIVRNKCVKDYYNESTNMTPLYEMKAHSEYRFDTIQPTHLHSVPLLTLDTSSIVLNDFKVSGHITEYPSIVLTSDVDEQTLDTPAPLSPYEKQAIPFYEYINKENIKPEDDSKIETAAFTETVKETEIIFNDETLERDALEQEGNSTLDGGETLHPKPNINQFTTISEPQMAEANETTHRGRDNTQRNITEHNIFNYFNSHHFFTSNPDQPTDWHSHQETSQKNEPQNSSISGAFLPGGTQRTLELPLNTAISANQNPEEYYNMNFPEEFIPENNSAPVQRIFAECPVAQNIILSTLPQIELKEVPKRTETISDHIFNRKESILEAAVEEEDSEEKKVLIEANLEESIDKKDTISCSESTIPLSMLLKRTREQNRLEYCRNIFARAEIKLDGTKKFACPPPLDKNKPKTSVKPCQPRPKPACEPCKPSPCPPKKDPCAKLLPIFLTTMIKCDEVSDSDLKLKGSTDLNMEPIKLTSVPFITRDIFKRIEEMCERLKSIGNNGVKNFNDVTIYARDFEPWIPIPSWPIAKKEESRPFVCPKEGCKVPVARTNKSSKEKQCEGLSKKSFAISHVFSSPTITGY